MESLPLPPPIPPLERFSGAEAEDFWQQQLPASLPPQMSPPPPFVGEEDAVHINAMWSLGSDALPQSFPAATERAATYNEIINVCGFKLGDDTTARASTTDSNKQIVTMVKRHTARAMRPGSKFKNTRGSYIKSEEEAARVLDDARVNPTGVSKKKVTKALSILKLADLREYASQPSGRPPPTAPPQSFLPSDHNQVNHEDYLRGDDECERCKDYDECRAQLQATVLIVSKSTAEMSTLLDLLAEARKKISVAEACNTLLTAQVDRLQKEISTNEAM